MKIILNIIPVVNDFSEILFQIRHLFEIHTKLFIKWDLFVVVG